MQPSSRNHEKLHPAHYDTAIWVGDTCVSGPRRVLQLLDRQMRVKGSALCRGGLLLCIIAVNSGVYVAANGTSEATLSQENEFVTNHDRCNASHN